MIPIKKDLFLEEYSKHYRSVSHVDGTALFFARNTEAIPSYIGKTMFQNGIIYNYNIIVIVKTSNEPHGISSTLEPLGEALDLLTIKPGYMEKLNVEQILLERRIDERAIFYGDEEIVSDNIFWKIFALIKALSPSFVSFYNFPYEKLIGIARRAKI